MKNAQNGQSLLEALIGLGVAVVIASAITIAVISSLSNAQFTKNQGLAAQYAQEGIETVRKIRTTDYDTFSKLAKGHYCLAKNSSELALRGASLICDQNVDNFVREVEINTDNANKCDFDTTKAVEVQVSVFWTDSDCRDTASPFCHKAQSTTCISDFTVVPTL